jgi:hypothetical protein
MAWCGGAGLGEAERCLLWQDEVRPAGAQAWRDEGWWGLAGPGPVWRGVMRLGESRTGTGGAEGPARFPAYDKEV